MISTIWLIVVQMLDKICVETNLMDWLIISSYSSLIVQLITGLAVALDFNTKNITYNILDLFAKKFYIIKSKAIKFKLFYINK